MRRDWLYTRFAINFVAGGLVAAWFAVAIVATCDIWFLISGTYPKLPLHREILYGLIAAIAAVFSAGNFFVFRPGWPKVVTVVVALCFGSYVIQLFVPIHNSHQLATLAFARIVGFCTLLLLLRTYRADLKAGRVEH